MDLDAPDAYGRAFADVYDRWYGQRDDTDATVARLAAWSGRLPLAELGVGTGRLAIPLAALGVEVHGVDASPEMLDRLAAKPGGAAVHTHLGDMVAGPPPRPAGYGVVVVAYNSLFNLTTRQRQADCIASSAGALAPGGRLVVEAFVPDPHIADAGGEPSGAAADVVTAWVHDPTAQTITGEHRPAAGSGRQRPWRIRYSHVHELDAMAGSAGLELEHRWSTWSGASFDASSTHHVSVWRRSA